MTNRADPSATDGRVGASHAYMAVAGLTKRFGPAVVVRDVSFDIERSEFVCVLGPSGCGKTTLLRLLAGFEIPDAGRIVQAGTDITRRPPEARDYGIVFQSYALFPNRTVVGNIAYGLESTGVKAADRRARVADLLALVGLGEHAGKYPNQLSGGQQQRVALARALALSPGLLLLDEPLSALDANVRAHLRDELRALQRRIGVTSLMVTHDQQEALSIADRIIVMNAGRIEQQGSPYDVFTRPANLFVARFLGEMNAFPVEAVDGATVRAGGLRLTTAGRLDPGARSRSLCIRPADVRLGPEAEDQSNAIRSTVAAVVFLGDNIRLTLRPDGVGPDGTILAEVSRSRLETFPSPGDAILAALPERHLLLLGETAEPSSVAA